MAASFRAPRVSNTPAYPKKLPIVLIATLATLLLTAGAIVTGELLRMTAPRASAAFAPSTVEPDVRLPAGSGACAGDRARASVSPTVEADEHSEPF